MWSCNAGLFLFLNKEDFKAAHYHFTNWASSSPKVRQSACDHKTVISIPRIGWEKSRTIEQAPDKCPWLFLSFFFFFTYILVIKNPNLKAWSHRFLSRNERCVYIIWRLPQAWLFLPSLPPNPQRFTRPVIFSSSSQTYGAWSWIFLLSIPATAPCDS